MPQTIKRADKTPYKPTLLLVGLGEIGGRLLEVLARAPSQGWRIVAASRSPEKAIQKVNAALFGASYSELFPDIEFVPLDLNDRTSAAELIARFTPALVITTASRSPWWARTLLPPDIRERLERVGAGPGIWAAGHLASTWRVVRAVSDAGLAAVVVNTAYPDVVHPALCRLASGPLLGVGNLDLLVPAIRYLVARDFQVSPRSVTPFLIAHNFHASRILSGLDLGGRLPILKVLVDGSDVTDRVDIKRLWQRIPTDMPVPIGAESAVLAVGSLCRTVLAIMADSGVMGHAPGPAGLPGGYPVVIGRSGARLALPAGISEELAVRVNREGQRAEGIQTIEPDATLVLTDTASEVLHDVFGMHARLITLDDTEVFAAELNARFSELAGRYGIHHPALRRSA